MHHESVPVHTALSVREFSPSKQITMLEHPPHSSDLAPCDLFSVSKVEGNLQGTHFDSADAITNNTMAALNTIPKD